MNKALIEKLIEHARLAADNAYCPYTSTAEGASLLVEGNIIFSGCNIECSIPSSSFDAGEVAILKAISEGQNGLLAICFFSERHMPYPHGRAAQLAGEFKRDLDIIVATKGTYSLHKLYELFPFLPQRITTED